MAGSSGEEGNSSRSCVRMHLVTRVVQAEAGAGRDGGDWGGARCARGGRCISGAIARCVREYDDPASESLSEQKGQLVFLQRGLGMKRKGAV